MNTAIDYFEPILSKGGSDYSRRMRALAEVLMTPRGATQKQLCNLLECSPPALRRHLDSLAYFLEPFGWQVFRRTKLGGERSPRIQLRYSAVMRTTEAPMAPAPQPSAPVAMAPQVERINGA